jgi:hypothetical protein
MLKPINDLLPLLAPEPCPICKAKVYVTNVEAWEVGTGKILEFTCDCETEPDIDSEEWWEWHNGHYAMPYVDWLPFKIRLQKWLDECYRYEG